MNHASTLGRRQQKLSPSRATDVRVTGAAVFLLPVKLRIPLKFGGQIVDEVTCARVAAEVQTAEGVRAVGWGETPLAQVIRRPGASASADAENLPLDDSTEKV